MWRTLRSKLLALVAVFLLLSVAATALQTAQYDRLRRSTNTLQYTYEVTNQDIARMRENILRLIAREKSLWLRGGQTDPIEDDVAAFEETWRDLQAERAQLSARPLDDDIRTTLSIYDGSLADYRASFDAALAAFRIDVTGPDRATADRRADAIMRGKGLNTSNQLGDVQTLMQAHTDATRLVQRQAITASEEATYVARAVSLAFVLSVGLWFAAHIGRRLQEMRRATGAVQRDRRDVMVPVRGHDELAELGGRFNAMIAALTLHERQLEELRRLALALTKATTAAEVCDIVVVGLAETFGYQYVSIYLLHPDDPENLHLASQRGYRTVVNPVPIATTVTGRAVRERIPLLITDAATETAFVRAEAQIAGEAVAPILAADTALGALLLEDDRPGALVADDLDLITTVANNVSVALENVRLKSEARERIQQLSGANRDLAAVTATGARLAATLDPDNVFEHVAHELSTILDAPTLYISLYDAATETIRLCVAWEGRERVAPFPIALDNSVSGWLVRHRTPLLLTRQEEVDAFAAREHATTRVRYPASLIGIPLLAGTEVIGAVMIGNPQPGMFSPRQFTVAQTIAGQAATAIHNAQPYDQVQRQVKTMQGLNLELARADRLKSEFLATMSHELRTPLNAVIGFSELLMDESVDDAVMRQACVADIYDSGQHLLSLINAILDISKIEAGRMGLKRERFDLRDETVAAIRFVHPAATGRAQTLTVDATANPVWVEADRQRIRQILLNLLSNATKFTPDGGAVRVELVPHAIGPNGPVAGVRVHDTGIGIREDDFPLLFEKFRQVDSSFNRRYEGAGLGLALTRQLVEMHGGEISVTSVYGVGSVFTFTVPLAAAPDALPLPSEVEGQTVFDDEPPVAAAVSAHARADSPDTLALHAGE